MIRIISFTAEVDLISNAIAGKLVLSMTMVIGILVAFLLMMMIFIT